MTVDTVYKIMQFIVNKNQQGNLSPADFNNVINQAQLSFFNFLIGEFQQYQNGRPVPRVQWGQNETIRQRMSPVIYGYINNIDVTGFAPYPGDYEQTDAMTKIYGGERIRFIQQDQFWFVYNSAINPYQNNPFYLIEDRGFRFFPTNLGQSKMSYVRTPPRIYWNYTYDSNSRPIYSASGSEQPVWSDSDMFDIVARALAMVGVNLQATQVIQYAQQIKEGGQ